MWGRFVYREIVAPERHEGKRRVSVERISYDATEEERETFGWAATE